MTAAMDTTTLQRRDDQHVLSHGPLTLTFEDGSGRLIRIESDTSTLAVADEPIQLEWLVGGEECRAPPDGTTTYPEAEAFGEARELQSIRLVRWGHSWELQLLSTSGRWDLHEVYTFEGGTTRFNWSFELVNRSDEPAKLRRTTFSLPIEGVEEADWHVDVPAAPLPPDRPLEGHPDGLIAERGPGPILGLLGLHEPETGGLASWVFSESFPTGVRVRKEASTLQMSYRLETAARLEPGEGISFDAIWFEPLDAPWSAFLDRFDEWWEHVGFDGPEHIPEWTVNASYFEAYVGHTVKDDTGYGPYPTIDDLIADLPRIRELGFDVLQLMPAQPAPSYLYPDAPWGDDAWGGVDGLLDLVEAAHGLGLRVILDVVIHGVLDGETLDRTLASIHERGLLDGDTALIAEYVVEHAPAWREHLPEKHPLFEERPEWFVVDDRGEIAHRYSRAFDLANPELQDYVIDRLISLVDDFGIDGFRIDAPAWNTMPNWEADLPYPAGYSPVGGVTLLQRARAAVKASRRDVLFYIEAASPLFRVSSEVTYPHDETWLPAAFAEEDASAYGRPLGDQSVSAAEMATWFERCERLNPPATRGRTVHHISSHDTVWWSPPGKKWCVERYGIPLTVATVAVLTLIEGSFMTFAGDERDIESHLARLLELRSRFPELSAGECRFDAIDSAESIFGALRELGELRSIVAVNFSDESVDTALGGSDAFLPEDSRFVVYDTLRREYLKNGEGEIIHDEPIDLAVGFEPWEPRLLVIRPTVAFPVGDAGPDRP